MRWEEGTESVWAGETASLQNGGGEGVSNAFQDTTWLYDQLGQQGEVGVSRMLRECLTCSRYAMLNATTMEPFPSFFATMLWRQVVGPTVLRVQRSDAQSNVNNTLRLYARCARAQPREGGGIFGNIN